MGRHLAIVCDLRSQGLFDELLDELDELRDHEITYSLLFLDASDEVLLLRFSERRRRHPIAAEGEAYGRPGAGATSGAGPSRLIRPRMVRSSATWDTRSSGTEPSERAQAR